MDPSAWEGLLLNILPPVVSALPLVKRARNGPGGGSQSVPRWFPLVSSLHLDHLQASWCMDCVCVLERWLCVTTKDEETIWDLETGWGLGLEVRPSALNIMCDALDWTLQPRWKCGNGLKQKLKGNESTISFPAGVNLKIETIQFSNYLNCSGHLFSLVSVS